MKTYVPSHMHICLDTIRTRIKVLRRASIYGQMSCLLLICLAACSIGGGGSSSTQGQTPVVVNGFGTAANHVHSFLAFPDNILLLATHVGLFRSSNDGVSWQEVAGGEKQLMSGLMTYSMTDSPLNSQRVYVLTQLAVNNPTGIQGLYTSADQGKTWKLVAKRSDIGYAFLAAAGNQSPDQVYVYIQSEGASGLKVSMDDGLHFTALGALPFGSIQGLLPIQGKPGQLIAYGDQGVARSTDGGLHWTALQDFNGGAIYAMTMAGPKMPVYASGDAGIFVSQDGGQTFKLVYSQTSYGGIIASPLNPSLVYGKTGRSLYQSRDGGKTWTTLPAIKGNLEVLAPDPTNQTTLFLSLSYPTEVYRFNQSSAAWLSLTPNA